MNTGVLEQAAAEANTGLEEIDLEMEQLETQRQSLEARRELLNGLVRQLLKILPQGDLQVDGVEQLDEALAAKPFPVLAGGQGAKVKDEWSDFVQRSTASFQGRP